jgi:hypothetical protein
VSVGALLLIGVVIAAAALAMLSALASVIRDFLAVQALQAECARLKSEYAERMKAMAAAAAAAPLPDRLVSGDFDLIERPRGEKR